MHSPLFTNLIVTYNSGAEVCGLLQDLQLHAPGSRTVVIDNASPDGTAALIRLQFPHVHLIRNDQNLGYARAVNQGFALSSSDYVFLLNPDIRIGSAAVFQELLRCLQREYKVAVAGPLQFKDDGKQPHLNFTWSYWTPRALAIYLSHLLRQEKVFSEPVAVTFLNAGCLFIRRSAFETVGRLNEKYFLYGEEPDLFLKLKRHGFECRLLPSVSVVHAREQSLRTVPSLRRLWFKLKGVRNIVDAVIRGLGNIILDRVGGRGPG
jgi:N-acetylglucosaminyl-diphospho-decaprenol L-rhamnosyltransferase